MSQGKTNPLRLIHLLQQTERKYFLDFNEETQTSGWRNTNIENSLSSGTTAVKESSFKGNFVTIPFYAETVYTNFILDFLQESRNADCIVELGCGYGRNLFELYYGGGPRVPYYGGELALAGQRLGTTLAELNPDLEFYFHPFDHTAPDLSWLPTYNKIFFHDRPYHRTGL